VDALSELLRVIRLSGTAFIDAELSAPWAVETPPPSALASRFASGTERIIPYHLVAHGACWVEPKGVLDVQFGNVWTNIPKTLFDELNIAIGDPVRVRIFHGRQLVNSAVVPYRRTFGEVPAGRPLVYVNSLMNLAVAINQGSYPSAHRIDSGTDWYIEFGKP
jgi:hypothetical protein